LIIGKTKTSLPTDFQKIRPLVTTAKAGAHKFLVFLDSGACPGPDPGSAGMAAKGIFRLLRHYQFGAYVFKLQSSMLNVEC
jgi:hypothetical protein